MMEDIGSEEMFAQSVIGESLCPFLERLDREEKTAQQKWDVIEAKKIAEKMEVEGGLCMGLVGTVGLFFGCRKMEDNFNHCLVAAMIGGIACYFFARCIYILLSDTSEQIVKQGDRGLNEERYARLMGKVTRIDAVATETAGDSDKSQLDRVKKFFESTIEREERGIDSRALDRAWL
ncbi:MAG: hypothetical protein AAGE99_02365 [Chlamydiota bacterium]